MYVFFPLLVIALVFILNNLYKRTSHHNNQFVDICKYWAEGGLRNDLQIINLGSYQAKFAFEYEHSNIVGENCAVGPQTLEYDYAILRYNTSRLKPSAVVIIPICLLSFFWYRQKDRTAHTKYYTFLPSYSVVNYNKYKKKMDVNYPLIFHPNYARYLFKDSPIDSRLEQNTNKLKDDNSLKMDAIHWIRDWNSQFNIQIPSIELSSVNQHDIQQNIKILSNMLKYCRNNGFQPVLTILPVTEYLSTWFTEDFVKRYIIDCINVANSVKAPVFNYLNDERFVDPSFYINSFFFNCVGRKKFSKVVINDIKDNNIL